MKTKFSPGDHIEPTSHLRDGHLCIVVSIENNKYYNLNYVSKETGHTESLRYPIDVIDHFYNLAPRPQKGEM